MITSKARTRSVAVLFMIGSLLSAAASMGGSDDKSEVSRAETQRKLDEAQRRLDSAAREVAELSRSMSDDVMPPHVMAFHGMRAQGSVLGMVIGPAAPAGKGEGVPVLSVSPGGGAAEAGLKAGDVITEINGKVLKQAGDETPDAQLRSVMRTIEPGEQVKLKYLRDGKAGAATVTTREPPDRMFNFRVPGPEAFAGFPNFAFRRADGFFGSAELVPLTPKLGQYFGSEKGLLVVRAPSDARLKLEEGDVIVDIDGRAPSSPSHALQILASYQPGEKLKLNVLRMKKRLTFDITIPEDMRNDGPHLQSRGLRVEPPDVVMPAPPMTAPLPPLVPGRRTIVTAPAPDETI
ncbi:MAG TPA: PDZ domain-containing protein [Povalibacter sp.]